MPDFLLLDDYTVPGFGLTHVWFKEGYALPLHSHDCDCLYYVIAGSLKMGTEELAESQTDDNGETSLDLRLDRYAASTYRLSLLARVFEAEGGRKFRHCIKEPRPEVLGRLFEGEVARQRLHVPAADDQPAFGSLHIRQHRLGGDDFFEARVHRSLPD